MTKAEPRGRLEHSPSMSPEIIEVLRSHGTRRTLAKNQLVGSSGEDFENLLIGAEGSISFSIMDRHGNRAVYGYLGPDSTWGLNAALTGKKATFFLEATERSVVTYVSRNTLWSLIDNDPDIRRGIIFTMGEAITRFVALGHSERTLPLRKRLAKFLVESANLNGTIELSQAELARNLGVSRYALGMRLQELKRQYLIEIEYRRVRIRDVDGLQSVINRP